MREAAYSYISKTVEAGGPLGDPSANPVGIAGGNSKLRRHSDALRACKASYRCLYKRKIPSPFMGVTSRLLRAHTNASTRSGENPARCRSKSLVNPHICSSRAGNVQT